MNNVYDQLAKKIIEAQETLIGPVAVMQAEKVNGLSLDWTNDHTVKVTDKGTDVINSLVEQYKSLFGQISVEVCKEAVGRLVGQLSADELPASLK